jgi:hypothetical protein
MVAAACCTAGSSAFAGRPMTTDDAALLSDKGCQVESWVERAESQTGYWMLPACNVGGNLELTLGGARIVGNGRTQNLTVVQGKTLFKPLSTDGWGFGMAVGSQSDAEHAADDNVFVNLPLSFSFHDDRVLLHINAGWLHPRAGGDLATWGIGTEWQWSERSAIAMEAFRQDAGKPSWQFSARHQLSERLQIDASYGDRFARGQGGRLVSIGIVLFADSIIP